MDVLYLSTPLTNNYLFIQELFVKGTRIEIKLEGGVSD